MTDYIVSGADLTAVADEIRSKGGTSAQLEFPSAFISAIEAISGGGGSAVVQPLSVSQNGVYNPPTGVDGYAPVTVNVSGGGGVPLLTQAEWDALTAAQKKAYGLVAIQNTSVGYKRGLLVNGADFSVEVFNAGWGASSATFAIDAAGTYDLYVIAMNSEASTKQLTIAATLGGTALTAEDVAYNSYSSSGTNRRNHRISRFNVTASAGDVVSITLSDQGSHAGLVYAFVQSEFQTLSKSLTTPDALTRGDNSVNGMVIYGTFNNAASGEISVEQYPAGTIIATNNPGTNYKSSYIFWFE